MGFINKLLGIKSQNQREQKTQKIIKNNILSYFQTDLKKIPDETYFKGDYEINSAGEDVYNYRKNLDSLEFGLFDTVELKIIDHRIKNIFFKTFRANTIKVNRLQSLIDDIYMLYGSDSQNRSKFSSKDLKDFNSKEFSELFGREWTDYPKYKYPITISKFDNELTLSIYGIEHVENDNKLDNYGKI